MKPVLDFETVTVEIHVPEWASPFDNLSPVLLEQFIDDYASEFEWDDHVTSAKLEGEPTLWYTFRSRKDAYTFVELLRMIWKQIHDPAGESPLN